MAVSSAEQLVTVALQRYELLLRRLSATTCIASSIADQLVVASAVEQQLAVVAAHQLIAAAAKMLVAGLAGLSSPPPPLSPVCYSCFLLSGYLNSGKILLQISCGIFARNVPHFLAVGWRRRTDWKWRKFHLEDRNRMLGACYFKYYRQSRSDQNRNQK
jgi:hypothetical protein